MTGLVVGALAAAVLLLAVLNSIERRRADERLAALLDRISTEPRIEVRPVVQAPAPILAATKYISDEPYMDAAWNELRGVTDEGEE